MRLSRFKLLPPSGAAMRTPVLTALLLALEHVRF